MQIDREDIALVADLKQFPAFDDRPDSHGVVVAGADDTCFVFAEDHLIDRFVVLPAPEFVAGAPVPDHDVSVVIARQQDLVVLAEHHAVDVVRVLQHGTRGTPA